MVFLHGHKVAEKRLS